MKSVAKLDIHVVPCKRNEHYEFSIILIQLYIVLIYSRLYLVLEIFENYYSRIEVLF